MPFFLFCLSVDILHLVNIDFFNKSSIIESVKGVIGMIKTLELLIQNCGNDVSFFRTKEMLYLTILDALEFDEDWEPIPRDYDNPKAIEFLLDWLESNCKHKSGTINIIYDFDDFSIMVDYSSYDA